MDAGDNDAEFLEMDTMDPSDDEVYSTSDGDSDGGEVEPFEASTHKEEEDDFTYKVLTPDDIAKEMIEIIKEVSGIVQLHATTTRMLLNHMKWDKNKLLDTYYTDADQLFDKAHIASPFNRVSPTDSGPSTRQHSRVPRIHSMPSEEECAICTDTLPAHILTGLQCGHRFCRRCWGEYLTTKIMSEGMGQTISCAAHLCDLLVDDSTVMELVHDKKVKQRYQQLITNSFVECNMLMRWCPSPDCPSAIRVSQPECKPVKCDCGTVFCFLCSHEWHDPINCRLLKKWLKKCSDDSETSNWISANTKECPKCHVTIEKNGGCNHMICKSVSCRHEFCWICLGPWQPHGSSWFNCNRYDDRAASDARDAQSISRAALERYLFYYNRYANHLQSMKLENKLNTQIKTKMEEIQAQNMSWIEVQFLSKAVDVLCQCRRTLMYTYAFSYYLKPNNDVHIFEDNQRDLEHATELLSEYLERDINKDNVTDIKQKVQDKMRYCDNRRVILLQHCKEGTEQDIWKYTD